MSLQVWSQGVPFPVWQTLQAIKEQMDESVAEGSYNKQPGTICNIYNKSLMASFPNIKKAHTQKKVKVENAEWYSFTGR